MSANVQVSVEEFITKFPEFTDYEYNEIMLEGSQCYISTINEGLLHDSCRKRAIYLLTAHLITIQKNFDNGNTSGLMQASATIDKVSVSSIPPPVDESNYWFFTTPYGQQLWMLFDFKFQTPSYIGGSFVRVLR